jgi:hypothetical protein
VVVVITSEKLIGGSTAEAKFWWLHPKKCSQCEKSSKTLARNTGHGLVSAGNTEARTTISRMPQSSGNYAENITTEVQTKAKDLIRDGSICTAHLLWLASVCCSEDAGASLTCAERLCK